MNSLTVIAECGPSIGLGHVMRTLAVAEAARDMGAAVTFISPELPHTVEDRLRRAGIARQAPGTAFADTDAILVDGYGFSAELMAGWLPHTNCLALMDDNAEHGGAPADLVINPNPHAGAALYAGWKGPSFLLGSAYAPLRREFLENDRPQARSEARHVLVTMGGSDPLQLTGHVINSLQQIDIELEITAVLGGVAPAPDIHTGRHSVTILRDVADMSEVMRRADIAISAAGSSLWELAHLGVPTVAIIVADNQVAAANAAAGRGMLALATRDTVAPEMQRLLEDAALRDGLARKAQAAVDGLGAQRILEAMAQFRRS